MGFMKFIVPVNPGIQGALTALETAILFPFRLFGAFGLLIGKLIFTLFELFVLVVFLPIMPYLVAYRNRKEYPKMSKAIVWMWSITVALIILIDILDTYA